MEKVRSFIAIELPPEVKRELAELRGRLRQGLGNFVKWVDPEGIHLTLKFLGGVEAGELSRIARAVTEASRGTGPFELRLQSVGVFPGLSSPRVVWVGVGGEVAKLAQLQQRVEATMEPLGFAREGRAFTAHLTLGRVRERTLAEERRELGRRVTGLEYEGGSSFWVTSMNLMRSQLTPQGAIYSLISEASLGPEKLRSDP